MEAVNNIYPDPFMRGIEAFKEALETGWTQELEDIAYSNCASRILFACEVYNSNLTEYINKELTDMVGLYDSDIILSIFKYNIANIIRYKCDRNLLFGAINGSNLRDNDKLELTDYVSNLLVKLVLV